MILLAPSSVPLSPWIRSLDLNPVPATGEQACREIVPDTIILLVSARLLSSRDLTAVLSQALFLQLSAQAQNPHFLPWCVAQRELGDFSDIPTLSR